MTRIAALALVAALASGCEQGSDMDLLTGRELELKVEALDARVDALADKAAATGAGPSAPDPKKAAHEQKAYETWKEMMVAREKGDTAKVKEVIAIIERDFADTRALAEIQDTKAEIETVGKAAVPLEVDKWFTGNASMDDGKATLLVFWEVWCPHCKREVPKLQATFDKYKGDGLNIVGITQVSNGKTDEEVMSFLTENKVSYPVAKSGPAIPEHYNVKGIPAAAVVKDGKVVWRGHPAMLNDALIEGWLGS